MSARICCFAALMSAMSFVTEAAAGNVVVQDLTPKSPQAGGAAATRAIGVCAPVSNNNASADDNVIIPLTSARGYFQLYENQTLTGFAAATILQQPKHGMLRLVTEADGSRFGEGRFVAANQLYVFFPDKGYVGNDTATIQMDFGNSLKVNVKYFFQAISGGLADDWMGEYCSKTGPYWKISSTLDANGTSTITSVNHRKTKGTVFYDYHRNTLTPVTVALD